MWNSTWSSTLTEQRSFHSSIVCAKSTMHNGTLCKQSVSILYYLIIDQLCYNQPIQERYVDDCSLAWIWGDIFFHLCYWKINWIEFFEAYDFIWFQSLYDWAKEMWKRKKTFWNWKTIAFWRSSDGKSVVSHSFFC